MRYWLVPFGWALLVGVAFFLLPAWLLPGLVDSNVLTDRLLKANYQLPELVSSYVPDLLLGVRLSFVAGAAVALGSFVLWAAGTLLFFRPIRPGQVEWSWRRVFWLVLAIGILFIAYAAVAVGVLGNLETVANAAATRLAVAVAVFALLAFWLLSLLGTERMMLPAGPLGTALRGRK